MSKKLTIHIDDELYNDLQAECKRFGYRSMSAYINKMLKQRKIVEIAHGSELASVIHQIKTLVTGDNRLIERREKLCQSYGSLMIEIEQLRNCVESLNTQSGMVSCRSDT